MRQRHRHAARIMNDDAWELPAGKRQRVMTERAMNTATVPARATVVKGALVITRRQDRRRLDRRSSQKQQRLRNAGARPQPAARERGLQPRQAIRLDGNRPVSRAASA